MRYIPTKSGTPCSTSDTDCYVVFVYEGGLLSPEAQKLTKLADAIQGAYSAHHWTGGLGEVTVLPLGENPTVRLILAGMGKSGEPFYYFDYEKLIDAVLKEISALKSKKVYWALLEQELATGSGIVGPMWPIKATVEACERRKLIKKYVKEFLLVAKPKFYATMVNIVRQVHKNPERYKPENVEWVCKIDNKPIDTKSSLRSTGRK